MNVPKLDLKGMVTELLHQELLCGHAADQSLIADTFEWYDTNHQNYIAEVRYDIQTHVSKEFTPANYRLGKIFSYHVKRSFFSGTHQ